MRDQALTLLEAVSLTALAGSFAAAVHHAPQQWVQDHQEIITACVLLYLPLIALTLRRAEWTNYGLGRPPLGRSLRHLALAMLAVLPLFYLVWFAGQLYIFQRALQPAVPPGLGQIILAQLLITSLPEEVFFRGYLQGQLNRAWKPGWNLLGITFGPGLLIAALLFTLAHLLLEVTLYRGLVFFPALLFGLLRESTGSVLAPILAHAICNVTFILAQYSLALS